MMPELNLDAMSDVALKIEYRWLRRELDYWRQKDNTIGLAQDNPAELDNERAFILDTMREIVGRMQRVEAVLRARADAHARDS